MRDFLAFPSASSASRSWARAVTWAWPSGTVRQHQRMYQSYEGFLSRLSIRRGGKVPELRVDGPDAFRSMTSRSLPGVSVPPDSRVRHETVVGGMGLIALATATPTHQTAGSLEDQIQRSWGSEPNGQDTSSESVISSNAPWIPNTLKLSRRCTSTITRLPRVSSRALIAASRKTSDAALDTGTTNIRRTNGKERAPRKNPLSKFKALHRITSFTNTHSELSIIVPRSGGGQVYGRARQILHSRCVRVGWGPGSSA